MIRISEIHIENVTVSFLYFYGVFDMQPSSRKQESRFDKPGPIVTPEVELYSNPRFRFAEPVTPEIISLIELNSERRFGDWSSINSIFLPTWIDSGVNGIRLHLKKKR